MARNHDVLVQIGKIDEMLKDTRVRDFCISCIRGPAGGCCQGCSNLGPNGCTDKPLACALWLCSKADKAFPQVAEALSIEKQKWPYRVANGMRLMSIRAEQELETVGAL